MSVGVVIARFQTPWLHDGHVRLLDLVSRAHATMVVLLGVRDLRANRSNPLSFDLRARMVRDRFPEAMVLPLPDHRFDDTWSENVDRILCSLYPKQSVTLYGGRDSFARHYSGQYKVEVVDLQCTDSSTAIRDRVARNPSRSRDFRCGVVYAHQHQFHHSDITVDVACVSGDRVLLIRKDGDPGWRFPGGFYDGRQDASLEQAARRELHEETGIAAEATPEYLGSYRINDWRLRGVHDVTITTAFFLVPHPWGQPEAGDDADEAKFFPLSQLPALLVPEHTMLFGPLLQAIQRAEANRVEVKG